MYHDIKKNKQINYYIIFKVIPLIKISRSQMFNFHLGTQATPKS